MAADCSVDVVVYEVGECRDRTHDHFWECENWSGDRAPARWIFRDASDRRAADPKNARFISDHLSVQLWVPDICVPAEGDWVSNLWWSSCSALQYRAEYDGPRSTRPSVWNIRRWISMEAELLAEREPILELRDSGREAHELRGAFPA